MSEQSIPAAARHAQPDEEPDPWTEPVPTGLRWTRRWRGVTGLTLLAIGFGLIIEQPGLLLASVFGVAFAAYGRLGAAPSPALEVERAIEVTDPDVGEQIPVTLTVHNDGDGRLRDLRIVDGVPSGLAVASGSPRIATSLPPGESAAVSYELEAARGGHTFDPVVAIVRDASGATERAVEIDAPGTIDCVPSLPAEPPPFPLRPQTTRYTGRTSAAEGGDGVEFHATREYRAGDPLGRIDWKRVARTGDLTTVEYRRERAASVLIVVDARRAAYAAPDPTAATSVDHCVEAARTIAGSLLDDGHSVGLTALSPRPPWLIPGRGVQHRLAIRTALGTHEAFERTPPDRSANVYAAGREIRNRIASDTQVVFVSPMLEEGASQAAHRLDAHGHLTTVVSPDVCVSDTVGQQAAGLARSLRLAGARQRGIPAIDWDPAEPFARALARSQRRWSA